MTFAAGEIKNPKKNLPFALIIGTIVILVLYFLINIAYLKVLPMDILIGEIKVGESILSFAIFKFLFFFKDIITLSTNPRSLFLLLPKSVGNLII